MKAPFPLTPCLALALLAAASPQASFAAEPDSPISMLERLVNANSGSANASGVDEIQTAVAQRLRELGFSVELKPNPSGEGKTGKLLIGTLTGESPRFVTLLAHADTVFEPSSPFRRFTLDADGKRATGPGIIDDKGGIVVGLHALGKLLKDGKKPAFSLRFVSSPAEETGSPGLHGELKRISEGSALVLGLEPALEDGSIVRSRRGNRWYLLRVEGKEAHAGRAHAEGINACQDLSGKLAAISGLTDYAADVTVSVGRMEGGQDKFNIVCGKAEAKLDVRFASLADGERVHKRIEAILAGPGARSAKTGEAARATYDLADDCPPFSPTARSMRLAGFYREIVRTVEGAPVEAKASGGAADSNYMSREGLDILDGLGPVGGKMHTQEEYLVVSSLETRAEALARFLAGLKGL